MFIKLYLIIYCKSCCFRLLSIGSCCTEMLRIQIFDILVQVQENFHLNVREFDVAFRLNLLLQLWSFPCPFGPVG